MRPQFLLFLNSNSDWPVRQPPPLGTTALGPAGLPPSSQAGRLTLRKRQTPLSRDLRPDSVGHRYSAGSPSVTPALGVRCLWCEDSSGNCLSRQWGKP